jgi:Fe2+ transport system protein FeoA
MQKCPFCGYETPREPALIAAIRRWFGGRHRRGAAGTLSDGVTGAHGVVTHLHARNQREVHKLMALGVLPGVSIRLLRRFPAYVFQVGYSQFTIDRELAQTISVRWEPAEAKPNCTQAANS